MRRISDRVEYDVDLYHFTRSPIKIFDDLKKETLIVYSRRGYLFRMKRTDIADRFLNEHKKPRHRCALCSEPKQSVHYILTQRGPMHVCWPCRKKYKLVNMKREIDL